ncbi:hypothetical protein IHQ56_14240 [Methylobacillus flagellatus]|nr:hypothetical protein [Methylobacillus flagellatus]
MEFAPKPEAHKDKYDLAESVLIHELKAKIEADAARIAELQAANARLRDRNTEHEARFEAETHRAEEYKARATKAEADVVRKDAALEPLARLEIPQRPAGNAGAYSIRHDDIVRARAALGRG